VVTSELSNFDDISFGVGESNFNDFLDRFLEADISVTFPVSTETPDSKNSSGAEAEVGANLNSDLDIGEVTGSRCFISSNW